MKKIYSTFILFISLFYLTQMASAQFATTKVRSVHEAYTDSLKNVTYDHVLPIWGQKAYKKGFDLPYPIGVMANYFWVKQGIDITNLQLGVQSTNVDVPLTSVDDLIQFGNNTNTSYSFNFRPDVWIFPFLNVYGVFGYGTSDTEVNIVKPLNLQSIVTQNISTAGFGVMGAFGVGPVWFSVDGNWTWNKPQLLDKPVRVNVLGIRMGHSFVFKNKPERNIAIWVGAMRVKMSTETSGSIQLSEAIPDLENQSQEIVNQYDEWRSANYASLSPAQKVAVNNVLDPIVERIDNIDGSAIIDYAMDKQVVDMWNGLIGAQFQYNKHWMLRTEAGVIGDRKSFLVSLNYRFLL
jgi:hypothetical protein